MRTIGLILAMWMCAGLAGAGHLVRLPLDKMLRERQVSVSATRSDLGRAQDILGASHQRMCRFVEQPARLTLLFRKPVVIGGARVRFSHHGGKFLWRVACADNAADLDAKKGTYRVPMAERSVPGDRTDEATWKPVRALAWRLECREDAGDPVLHLRWFGLLCSEEDYVPLLTDGAKLTGLRLTRQGRPISASLDVPGNRPLLVGVQGVGEDGKTFDLTGAARLVVSRPDVLEPLDATVLIPRRPGKCSIHAEIVAHASPIVRVTVPATRDLILLCIERTPRYPKYHPRYQNFTFDEGFARHEASFAVGLERGETAKTQRWPEPGDTMTYRAIVFNRGNAPVEDAQALWFVDGREQASLPVPAIEPGKSIRVAFQHPWKSQRETIRCELLARDDATPGNNRLERASDALEFIFLVEEGYRLRFAARTERVKKPATASVVEWIHHHFRRFNRMFAERGCKARIAVGHLAIVPDGAPDPPAAFLANFDGRFPPRFAAQDSDWRLGGSGYYRPGDDIDYGFLHECGHQLGLVDLYRLNLERSQNKVTGERYRWGDCVMSNVAPKLSEFTARALDAWHGRRRGFYGQYLYDLPTTVAVRLQDADGTSLARRDVAVYQKVIVPGKGELLWPKPKFRGKTDGKGVYVLPNVPVEHKGMKPLPTGNVLRPNPWGHVACVGFNGLFLIEATTEAGKLYAWLPITEADLAYWRGERDRATIALTMRPAKSRK